jgi:nitroreductase
VEIMEGIKTRYSARGFKPDPVPRDVINRILEAVTNTPSYTNTQPWEVVVVSGKKRDELSKAIFELAKAKAPTNPDLPMPKSWPEGHDARAHQHGERRLDTLGIERGDEEGRERLRLMNFEFYGAPCVAFLFIDGTLGEWSVFDMGLFAQNLILAAHSLGVESVLQASVTNYAPEIKKFLGVPANKKLVIGIPLGYVDDGAKLNAYRSLKQKPEEFTSWCE